MIATRLLNDADLMKGGSYMSDLTSITLQIDSEKKRELIRMADAKGLTLSNLIRMTLYSEIEKDKAA